jgi:hypothetical protein
MVQFQHFLHDDIWINENLTHGIGKNLDKNLLKYCSQPSITIVQFICIEIVTYGALAYWLNFEKS